MSVGLVSYMNPSDYDKNQLNSQEDSNREKSERNKQINDKRSLSNGFEVENLPKKNSSFFNKEKNEINKEIEIEKKQECSFCFDNKLELKKCIIF